jgi:hypothetical protein
MITYVTFHYFADCLKNVMSRNAAAILWEYLIQQENITGEIIFYDTSEIADTYREIPLNEITDRVRVIGCTKTTAVVTDRV